MDKYDAPVEPENNNRKLGPVTIYVDFAKSIIGISFVVAAVSSLLGFICVETAAWIYCSSFGPMRFFNFVSMTSFWGMSVLYFVFLMGGNKFILFIAWELTTLIWAAFDFIFFLISSSILAAAAANSCVSAGGLTAGAVFGFLTMPFLGIIFFSMFREYRKRVTISRGDHTPSTPQPVAGEVY